MVDVMDVGMGVRVGFGVWVGVWVDVGMGFGVIVGVHMLLGRGSSATILCLGCTSGSSVPTCARAKIIPGILKKIQHFGSHNRHMPIFIYIYMHINIYIYVWSLPNQIIVPT